MAKKKNIYIYSITQSLYFFFLVPSFLIANKDTDQGVRYSSRGGQVNYNEDENDWGISSEDDKLPVYTKPVVPEEEGDVIESVHDFRRTGRKENIPTMLKHCDSKYWWRLFSFLSKKDIKL